MIRDGITVKPPSGRGERAWWLYQVVAATPLSTWSVDLVPQADPLLRQAWATAAARQQDAAWALALLDAGDVTEPGLLTAVPHDRAVALVTDRLAAGGFTPTVLDLLAHCPTPWGRDLSRLVVERLGPAVKRRDAALRAPAGRSGAPARPVRGPLRRRPARRSRRTMVRRGGLVPRPADVPRRHAGGDLLSTDTAAPARRGRLRHRAGRPRRRRHPRPPAQLAAVAVGGVHLPARRRGRTARRSRPSTSGPAAWSRSPSPPWPPTGRCCCSASRARPRRGSASTWPPPSRATRPCWSRARRARPRRPSATAGTTPACWPRARRWPPSCPAR